MGTGNLGPQDYIGLWQYFSQRAETLQDRAWTVATWLLAIATAILAFIFTDGRLSLAEPVSAAALSLLGLAVCAYGVVVMKHYAHHISRNWARSRVLSEKIESLKAILDTEPLLSEGNVAVCQRLTWFAVVFGLAFVAVLVAAVVKLWLQYSGPSP